MASALLLRGWAFLGANMAQIVAVLALVVAVVGFRTQRRHNRLSVRPCLATSNDVQHDARRVTFWVRNNGLGPALITGFEIYLDGRKKKEDGSTFTADEVIRVVLDGVERTVSHTQFGIHYTMPASESVPVLNIALPPQEFISIPDLLVRLDRISLIIKYESYYGERFELETGK